MPFLGSPLTISRIWVIPWEEDEGLWGVAYEFTDGGSACDEVGSKVEAQAVVDEVERQRAAASGENVIDLADAVARHPTRR